MRGLNLLKQSVAPKTVPEKPKGLELLKQSSDPNKAPGSDNIFEVGEERTGRRDLTNRDYLTGYENPDTIFEDEGGLNEVRANRQTWGSKAATGIGRVITKAGSEVLKMPGIAVGAVAAPFAEEGKGWDTFVNNSWVKNIQSMNDQINEDILPVYVKKAVKDGDLMDNLTSIDFWSTEGADGAGYIVSMFAPGALIKSFNIGSKLTKFVAMSEKLSKAQRVLGITPTAIDHFAISTANTIFESAAEAGNAMDTFEKDLSAKFQAGEISEEEYTKLLTQKGELGRDMFLTNLAILAGPNMINTKLLYGGAKASKLAVRNAEGALIDQVASPSVLRRLGDTGKGFAKALGREGFFEEGLQSTTENYFKKQAGKGKLTDNYLDNINATEFANEYLDMLTTTDGQKAIALGGLLGGPLDVMHNYKQGNADRRETNKLLADVREANNIYLATTINPDIWKRTEAIDAETGEHAYELVNGKRIVDPVKRNALIAKASNSEKFGQIFDLAQNLANTEALGLLQSQAEDNLIAPFITDNEDGVAMLIDYLDNSPNISKEAYKRIVEKASVMKNAQDEFNDFSEPVLNLSNKQSTANQVMDFYNDLKNTYITNKTQSHQAYNELDLVDKRITQIKTDDNITDDINPTGVERYVSKDTRLKKLYKDKEALENKIKDLKEKSRRIWNPKEQKAAFDEYIKSNLKITEDESEDKINTVNDVTDKINNAKTAKEVADAVNGKTAKTEIEDSSESITPETQIVGNEDEAPELDTNTKSVIDGIAQKRISEIVADENTQITEANDAVSADIADIKESILADVREMNNVIIDGTEYYFVEFMGLINMSTTNNSAAEVFPNIEAAVEYFEELLNKNVIETPTQTKIDNNFENTSVIHVDQSEGTEVLQESDDVQEEAGVNKKFPTIGTTGVERKTGKPFDWLPIKFKNWLVNFKDKKGTPVTFSMPEISKISYSTKQMAAVKMLQSKDFTNKDFLYRHLPLQVNIEQDNYTFIATIEEDVVEEGTERYVARKNIVEAILNNKGSYDGVLSKIDYQKGGDLNTVEPIHVKDVTGADVGIELPENNIAAIPEFNGDFKNIPLFFVKDELGGVYDENKNDYDNFPSSLTSVQKGYIYTTIHAYNGERVPVKLNVRKLNLAQATVVYETYRALYTYNKENKVKLSQDNAKLDDIFASNPQLKAVVDKQFAKELSIFKIRKNVTVGNFMTLLIHDNMALDGSTKPYTTKYKGAGITFGEDAFINFEKEFSEFKDAFMDFLMNQKRQNVKLDFLAGAAPNVNKSAYKNYLINEKVLNVNLNTAQPFAGDINVYVDSDVTIEERIPEVVIPNDISDVSDEDSMFSTGLQSAKKGDKGIYWTNFKGSRQDYETDEEVTVEAVSKFGVKFVGDEKWKNFKDTWHNFKKVDSKTEDKSKKKSELRELIASLPNDKLYITHITSDNNAKNIFDSQLRMPAGLEATTGIVGKENLLKVLENLIDGNSPHRGFFGMFIGQVDKATIEAMPGRTLQDKLTNYIDENYVDDAARTQLPASMNFGYFVDGKLNISNTQILQNKPLNSEKKDVSSPTGVFTEVLLELRKLWTSDKSYVNRSARGSEAWETIKADEKNITPEDLYNISEEISGELYDLLNSAYEYKTGKTFKGISTNDSSKPAPPGSKGGRFAKKTNPNNRPDGFGKTGC